MSKPALEYGAWVKKAHDGSCCNCNTEGLVFPYERSRTSPYYHLGTHMELCYICSHVAGTNSQEYPDQHPNRGIVNPILGAISTAFQIIAKPKLPPKPRTPRLMKRNKGTP